MLQVENENTENGKVSKKTGKPFYPFSAIVGKERAKLGLILNAIDPSIGGILLTGPKGSGKSTLVRALSRIFPEIETVKDCSFNCSPSDITNMCDACKSRLETNGFLPKVKKKIRIVQIPIGATEDRILGSIDVEKVLREGIRALHSGLLAEANQGILYLDEANLLPDHLVDIILDTAVSGWNIVEREGISANHPARFMLIGTMNPEEGELRPQLMDRFGLHVKVENIQEAKERAEVIKRNLEFSENPDRFVKKFDLEDEKVLLEIIEARGNLSKIVVPQHILETIARLHLNLRVDGYRPDIVTMKTAVAHAALMRRLVVTEEDVQIASELTLTHRTRNVGKEKPPTIQEIQLSIKGAQEKKKSSNFNVLARARTNLPELRLELNKLITFSPLQALLLFIPVILLLTFLFLRFGYTLTNYTLGIILLFLTIIVLILLLYSRRHSKPGTTQIKLLDLGKITTSQGDLSQVVIEDSEGIIRTPTLADLQNERSAMLEEMMNEMIMNNEIPLNPEPLKSSKRSKEGKARRGTQYLVGKRARIVTSSSKGRYTYYQPPKKKPWDIAFVPTIRAASLFQRTRKNDRVSVDIRPKDLQVKIREYRAPFSIALLVDMSGSMTSSLVNIGRAIFRLHRSVYRRRDRISLIIFKGKDAVVLQQPTTNLDMAVEKLRKQKTSDFTPMAQGLLRAWRLLQLEKQRNKDVVPILIIISDGIVNVELNNPLSSVNRTYYMSKAQADVVDLAQVLKRDGIRVIVINTSHRKKEIPSDAFRKIVSNREWYTPTEMMLELARITNGSYYGLSLAHDVTESIIKSKLDDWFFFEDKA